MSRGLGRVERAVLDHLKDRPEGKPESRLEVIAAYIEYHPESIRRAMKSLARKGLVELGRDNGYRVLPDDPVDGGEIVSWHVTRWWDSPNLTAKLSAGYEPTLTQEVRS